MTNAFVLQQFSAWEINPW